MRTSTCVALFTLVFGVSCGETEDSSNSDPTGLTTDIATSGSNTATAPGAGTMSGPGPSAVAPGSTASATSSSSGGPPSASVTPPMLPATTAPVSTPEPTQDTGGAGGTPGASGSPAVGGAPFGGASSGGTLSGGAPSGGTPNASAGGGNGGEGEQGPGGNPNTAGAGGSEPAVSCEGLALSPGNTTRTIEVGGQQREFILQVPSAYQGDEAVPLIVDFHPLGGSGDGEQGSSPYSGEVSGDGVIMAFPTGLAGPSGRAWNVGPCCVDDVDDVEFARALVDEVKGLACIDPKRVYAVGFSMGGGMSHYLACHAADVFAAVAPAAFDLLEENVEGCMPSRPITVISFRGTSDGVVPYDGGFSNVVSGHPVTFLGALNTMEAWAEINGCMGAAADLGDNCQGYTASQCEAGVEVILCTQQGGGHAAGNANIAWPVLQRHTLP